MNYVNLEIVTHLLLLTFAFFRASTVQSGILPVTLLNGANSAVDITQFQFSLRILCVSK